MFASTSNLISIIASMSILASEVQALPTRRSTSQLSRRAASSRHQRRATPFEKRAETGTSLGDHSIVVDSSAKSASEGAGGIKNSTINLTVISRRSSAPSTFSRVARALFGRSPAPVAAPVVVPVQERKPLGVHQHSKALKRSTGHAATAKVIRRQQRKPRKAKAAKRAVMVTDMAEQQSIYRAAVAALASPTSSNTFATTAPVVLAAAVPTTSSIIANPKSIRLASASSVETASSSIAEASSTNVAEPEPTPLAAEVPLEPITLTMTLVANPSAPSVYINQAALSTSSIAAPVAASTEVPSSSAAGFRKARRSPQATHARRHAKRVAEHAAWVPYVHVPSV